MSEPLLPRCPHCGAVGTKIEAPIYLREILVDDAYCGACGKNWPKPNTRANE